jgi:predicted signal transduction protein with EAL and GGDEF domain
VETQEQLAFLRRHGCDEAQGYYIARPMHVDAMSRLLGTAISGRHGKGPISAGTYIRNEAEPLDVAAR